MVDETENRGEKRQERALNRFIDRKFNGVAVTRDEVEDYWERGRGAWFIGLMIIVFGVVGLLVAVGVL